MEKGTDISIDAGTNYAALTRTSISVMKIVSDSGKRWAANFRGGVHLTSIDSVLKRGTWTHTVPLVWCHGRIRQPLFLFYHDDLGIFPRRPQLELGPV